MGEEMGCKKSEEDHFRSCKGGNDWFLCAVRYVGQGMGLLEER